MKFKLSDKPFHLSQMGLNVDLYVIMEIEPERKPIAGFLNENVAGDYVEFLNDKYCDKEINQEWPPINKEERIRYHLEQIELLKSDKPLRWNEHGNGVE